MAILFRNVVLLVVNPTAKMLVATHNSNLMGLVFINDAHESGRGRTKIFLLDLMRMASAQ